MAETNDSSEGAGLRPQPKKLPYRRPELVEYGSVAKLTQGALSTMNEGVGFNMSMCL
jgi:hypothetical protein